MNKQKAPPTYFESLQALIEAEKAGEIQYGEFVKLFKSAGTIDIGRNTFLKWMRNSGYISKVSEQPMQKYIMKGWFTQKYVEEKDGKYYQRTLITPKGKLPLAKAYVSCLKES